jgi:hypothetical protein
MTGRKSFSCVSGSRFNDRGMVFSSIVLARMLALYHVVIDRCRQQQLQFLQ